MSRWQPGQSGNPKGRPAGSKHKLSESFVEALLADWQQHGKQAIERVRIDRPDQYLKVIASLVPKDLNVQSGIPLEEWTDEELETLGVMLEQIRAEQTGG